MADSADETYSVPEVYNVWDHIDITAAMAAQVKLNVPSEDVPAEGVVPVSAAPVWSPPAASSPNSTPAPSADSSANSNKEN